MWEGGLFPSFYFYLISRTMSLLTTKLQAVNVMIGYLGEAPVNSISDNVGLPLSVSQAKTILDETSKGIQVDGWFFNIEKDVTFSPDVETNFIDLSGDILSADSVDGHKDNVVVRGSRLYDLTDNTYEFTKPVKMDLIRFLEWDFLPEAARRYINLKASRILVARSLGAPEIEQLILRDEVFAKARLESLDSGTSDRTIFDSYDTAIRIGVNRPQNIL